jgi:hypothetical protein
VVAVLLGATASVIGSLLTYLVGIRSVHRSVRTSNGVPLDSLVESRLDSVERRLDGMERSIADVREWLAFREGKGASAALGDACSLAARQPRGST